jgi:polar amino acid transport system substrate-binding protein
MKKLMTATLVALATSLLASAAFAEPLRIGVDAGPYPPFASPDASGKWVGWEIEFMEAVCAEAKVECVVTPTAWDGIIPALTENKLDAIMGSMSITEERMKTIDFSNRYYKTPASIATSKGSGIAATPEGLAGKIIGVQGSTIHAAYAAKYFAPTAAEVKIYQTQDEANQDLAAGRVDALLADSLVLDAFIKSEPGTACCEIVGNVADDPAILGLGVGIGLRKGDPMKETFNAAIAAVRASGKYDEISKKYFNFDVYGE